MLFVVVVVCWWWWSVGRCRRELLKYAGVSAQVLAGCTERADLLLKLKEIHAAHIERQFHHSHARASASAASSSSAASSAFAFPSSSSAASGSSAELTREQLKERIVKEVEAWSKGKTIHKLLNDVNGVKTPDKNYLKRYGAARFPSFRPFAMLILGVLLALG